MLNIKQNRKDDIGNVDHDANVDNNVDNVEHNVDNGGNNIDGR